MKLLCSTLTLLLITVAGMAQKENASATYKNLPVKKFYSAFTETATVNGKTIYKANGKEITKAQYDAMNASRSAIAECTPCMLETYDENGKLSTKAVQYKDCYVGSFTAYYPNGKIKTQGHYRENESDTWEPLWDNGYCIKHGAWTEYDAKGKVIKTENYNFGNLKN